MSLSTFIEKYARYKTITNYVTDVFYLDEDIMDPHVSLGKKELVSDSTQLDSQEFNFKNIKEQPRWLGGFSVKIKPKNGEMIVKVNTTVELKFKELSIGQKSPSTSVSRSLTSAEAIRMLQQLSSTGELFPMRAEVLPILVTKAVISGEVTGHEKFSDEIRGFVDEEAKNLLNGLIKTDALIGSIIRCGPEFENIEKFEKLKELKRYGVDLKTSKVDKAVFFGHLAGKFPKNKILSKSCHLDERISRKFREIKRTIGKALAHGEAVSFSIYDPLFYKETYITELFLEKEELDQLKMVEDLIDLAKSDEQILALLVDDRFPIGHCFHERCRKLSIEENPDFLKGYIQFIGLIKNSNSRKSIHIEFKRIYEKHIMLSDRSADFFEIRKVVNIENSTIQNIKSAIDLQSDPIELKKALDEVVSEVLDLMSDYIAL